MRLPAPPLSATVVSLCYPCPCAPIPDRFLLDALSRGASIAARDLQLVYFAALCASVRVHGGAAGAAAPPPDVLRTVSGATFYSDADVADAEQRISRAFGGGGDAAGAAAAVTASPRPLPLPERGVADAGPTSVVAGSRNGISEAVLTQPSSYAAALVEFLPPAWARRVAGLVEAAVFTCHVVRRGRGEQRGVAWFEPPCPTPPPSQEPELHRYHPATRALAAVYLALRVADLAGHATALAWLTIALRVVHADPAVVRECSDAIEALAGPGSELARAEPAVPLATAEAASLRELLGRRVAVSDWARARRPGELSNAMAALVRLAAVHPRSVRDAADIELGLREVSDAPGSREGDSHGSLLPAPRPEVAAAAEPSLGAAGDIAPPSAFSPPARVVRVGSRQVLAAGADDQLAPPTSARRCTGATAAALDRVPSATAVAASAAAVHAAVNLVEDVTENRPLAQDTVTASGGAAITSPRYATTSPRLTTPAVRDLTSISHAAVLDEPRGGRVALTRSYSRIAPALSPDAGPAAGTDGTPGVGSNAKLPSTPSQEPAESRADLLPPSLTMSSPPAAIEATAAPTCCCVS